MNPRDDLLCLPSWHHGKQCRLSSDFCANHEIRFAIVKTSCRISFNVLTTRFLHRPPGVFEFDNFAAGTKGMMDAVVTATQNGAISIAGVY